MLTEKADLSTSGKEVIVRLDGGVGALSPPRAFHKRFSSSCPQARSVAFKLLPNWAVHCQ
eukprot:125134-Chlamydomonas_euryale.AAC.2